MSQHLCQKCGVILCGNGVVAENKTVLLCQAETLFQRADERFEGGRLYELWARRDIEQDPERLHRVYADVARREGMLLVLAGTTWRVATRRYPSLDPFQSDGYHAQPLGTYLAACAFFGALLQKSPEGKPGIPGVSRELLLELQRVAWSVRSVAQ